MKKSIRKKIQLKPVLKSDFSFLYELLIQRRPIANISHKRMPSYEEHIRFVTSKPYSKWYIILYGDKKIGSVYLSKQNEIGIHLLREYEKESTYLKVIKEITLTNSKKQFLVNIAPKNIMYIRLFKKLGFKMIQHTYELDLRKNF